MALDPLRKATEESIRNLVLGREGVNLSFAAITLSNIVGPILGEPDKEE